MAVVNAEIATELNKSRRPVGHQGANPFRVRAYRQAARTVDTLPHSVADMLAAGEDLDELSGISKDPRRRDRSSYRGERLPILDDLERSAPADVLHCWRCLASGRSG
jgi:DNA polymerase (family X)